MKKALSLLLVLVMLIGLMPMQAFATEADSGTKNTFPAILHGHIQMIPDGVYAHTNLWELLEPENGYFYAGTHWGTLDDVVSVTIPVAPGDQIFASSFARGIRVTFFDTNGILVSLSSTEIKEEFGRNGYVTAPEYAVAVNIPMWDNSADNVLKILTLEHLECRDHVFTLQETVKEPSLVTKGSMVRYCENCGFSETVDIPELMLPDTYAYQDGDRSIILPYRLYYPSTYELDTQTQYPVVIFYHGAGSRGNDNESQVLGKAIIDRLAGLDNCIIVAPQCDSGYQWVNTPWGNGSYNSASIQKSIYLDASIALLDDIVLEERVDENRVYAIGQSMGGYATWNVMMEYPEKFAAIIPVCGAADPDRANEVLNVAVWAFHGDEDSTVPVSGSREMIDAMRNLGGVDVKYTEYAGVGHSSWVNAFAEPELTDWLFSKCKHTHSYTATVTAPTCTEKGYTTYTCECGDSYVADLLDATDHTYKNGICTVCGEEDYDGLDLNGLNVLCLGDSITAGQGLTTETRWTNVLASKYGWNLTNKSQGGISLSSYYYTANGKSNVSIAKKAEILKTMTTKPDVIIVWGGHNDTSYRYSPLGTWDDETTDSFKGALKYIAELADEYAPDATLFVLTPLWTTEAPSTLKVPENTTDNNWMFVDAIYEGAEAYGWIPVNMDLCGITPFTKSGLLLDNIHPNEAGTEKIVAYLSAELASYSETSKKETIIFNASAVSMKPGESTTLKAVLSPRSGTGTMTFTWSSSDSSVATVDTSGKITAVAPGTAVITATAPNGISADISVSVVCEHTYEPSVTAPTCTEQGYTTYTCACGDSYVADYVDATGDHTYENGICTGCGVNEWDTDGDGVLEILAIGNSFSVDALQYAYQIAQNLGIEKIAIGNLYIGGCTLATHAANAAGDLGKYTYYYNDNGTWTSTGSYKISTALESRSWDYVSMQQGSPVSGVESSYNEDLTNLISYVKERSDAKLVWHMTWAYQQNSSHSAFPTYGKDQMTMYNAVVSAVQNKIVTNENFDLIVPNGTVVQNSRTSLLGDTTTRDGYHMSYDYGRYLTGLMFMKTVTGQSVDKITYRPSGVDELERQIAIESVNNATANPFAVTSSVYTGEVPDDGYVLLQPEMVSCGYWHSIGADHYNTVVTNASNSKSFFATIRFTPETLPIGSVIILEDGWQYRPEGWLTDTLQTQREDNVTQPYVIVTAEWWGDYTIRAFNISKVGLPSLENVTEEEVRTAFRIYVPEELHECVFENNVCMLCSKTNGPVITQQPVDGEAKLGERYMVEVKAEGEGLKYQWYFRNAGSKTWYKSSVKDNTYDDVMTAARAGRVIYCVITDALGNTVKTDTVKLVCLPSEKLEITRQPTDGEAVLGERYCVTVEAKGESLKYQWYFRNKGAKSWTKSSVTDNTYDDVMTTTRNGREVYCVITDLAGNKVTTDTVKLVRVPMKLEIVSQPKDASAPFNQLFCVTVKAKGEGLKYQWYYRNAGGLFWYKSGVRDNTYDDTMTKARNGREVYCVITDKYGNSVTTDIAKLVAVPEVELKLLSLSYEGAAMGERFCVSVEAQGDGLKYQWYFRNAGATRWSMSGVRDNTYDDVMNKTRANRQVYCVITDAFGNQVTTETVTLVLSK